MQQTIHPQTYIESANKNFPEQNQPRKERKKTLTDCMADEHGTDPTPMECEEDPKNIYARLLDPADPISHASGACGPRAPSRFGDSILSSDGVTRVLPSSYVSLYDPAKMAIHHQQCEESDGFYVNPRASGNLCFGILNKRFNPEDENDRYVKHAKLSVIIYNEKLDDNELTKEDTDGKLEFVKLVNVTGLACKGWLLYLTFEAKNPGEDQIRFYQSVVWEKPYKGALVPEVLSFRPRPTPGSEKIWFWNNHD